LTEVDKTQISTKQNGQVQIKCTD